MAKTRIPFVDLRAQYESIKAEIQEAINRTVEESAFIMGKPVSDFEAEFGAFCGAPFVVGCSSGTTAIHLALMGFEIGAKDAVITVPNTFIATSEGISHAGALPLFVDVDEATSNLSPKRLAEFLEKDCRLDSASGRPVHRASGRTVRAVLAVHLYGCPADMDGIRGICDRYHLWLIEDAAQAHGGKYRGRPVGALGDAACFSFFPGKNLGAYGDAGAVTTTHKKAFEKMQLLVNHGRLDKYEHLVEGYNYRIDALQARILSVKLRHLPGWTRRRQENAKTYDRLLAGWEGQLPSHPESVEPVYHLYVVRSKGRDDLARQLGDAGIASGIHYPLPLHLQRAYAHLGYKKGDFPVTERLAGEILSLPMYPELTADQIAEVVRVVRG